MAESRLLMSVAGMQLPLFTTGQTWYAVNVAGTWTGTISFTASQDGVNYSPVSLTPFATGTAVSSVTANGSWYMPVGNNFSYNVTLTTLGSGNPIVTVGTSVDTSFQTTFMTPVLKYVNQAANNATNTVTIAAVTNRAFRLRTLILSLDSAATWASSPALQIKDGSTVLWAMDPPVAQGTYQVPLPADPGIPGVGGGGIVNTPGNTLVIALAASGGKTNINGQLSAA